MPLRSIGIHGVLQSMQTGDFVCWSAAFAWSAARCLSPISLEQLQQRTILVSVAPLSPAPAMLSEGGRGCGTPLPTPWCKARRRVARERASRTRSVDRWRCARRTWDEVRVVAGRQARVEGRKARMEGQTRRRRAPAVSYGGPRGSSAGCGTLPGKPEPK